MAHREEKTGFHHGLLGFILLSPILVIVILLTLFSAACDLPGLLQDPKRDFVQDLGKVELERYSVHLLRDSGGGATVSFALSIEQRLPLLPGVYLRRELDSFYGAYEGKLTVVRSDAVRVQIPQGVGGSGWNKQVDQVYHLKRYVYF